MGLKNHYEVTVGKYKVEVGDIYYHPPQPPYEEEKIIRKTFGIKISWRF